jgi:hypothetical protein
MITRMGLRSARHMLPTLREYRRLVRATEQPESFGLLKSAFLLESPSTCYSLSLWAGQPDFSAHVPRHIDAVRKAFSRVEMDDTRGPEVWSTTWRLSSVSHNLNWGDFDLRAAIAAEAR